MAALLEFTPMTNNSLNLPAEIPILSLFNFKPKSQAGQREIQPGMDTETIADILSDRLIEMVRKDMMRQDTVSDKRTQEVKSPVNQ